MNVTEKIDKIFSIVSKTDTRLSVLETEFKNTERRINGHEVRINETENSVDDLKTEKAKYGMIGRFAMFILGIIGGITGSIIVIVITNYFLK